MPSSTKEFLYEADDHEDFLYRIKKTLYYGTMPYKERLSLPVTEVAAEVFTKVKHDHSIQSLDIEEVANISRIACVSPCCLILAFQYLYRLKKSNPDYICSVTPSELFVVSMMVANKFLVDDPNDGLVFSDAWALIWGRNKEELKWSEQEFLHSIKWDLYVTKDTFFKSLQKLETDIALREGRKRGWYSYTDLNVLLENMDLIKYVKTMVEVCAVCTTVYVASVLTLIGSVVIVSRIPAVTRDTFLNTPVMNFPIYYNIRPMNVLPTNFSLPDLALLDLPLLDLPRLDIPLSDLPLLGYLSTSVTENEMDNLLLDGYFNSYDNCSAEIMIPLSYDALPHHKTCVDPMAKIVTVNDSKKWMSWLSLKKIGTDDSITLYGILSSNS